MNSPVREDPRADRGDLARSDRWIRKSRSSTCFRSYPEVRALLDAQDRDTLTGCRNYALILFLLDTGVRASDCIGVELADVDWEQNRVLIRHGEGEKERCVGLGKETSVALRDYVQRFRTVGDGALFLTSAG